MRNGRLRVFVQANVREGISEVLCRGEAARRTGDLGLPSGMTVEYAASSRELIRAEQTLRIVIPMSLLIIFLLLASCTTPQGAARLSPVPLCAGGGVFLQYHWDTTSASPSGSVLSRCSGIAIQTEW